MIFTEIYNLFNKRFELLSKKDKLNRKNLFDENITESKNKDPITNINIPCVLLSFSVISLTSSLFTFESNSLTLTTCTTADISKKAINAINKFVMFYNKIRTVIHMKFMGVGTH